MIDQLASLGLQSLALFAATVFIVNATPGADLVLTFTSTMQRGVRGGLATAAGIAAGCLVHTALVVLGVAALIAASPLAYRALQWAGALYLVWMAVSLAREGFRSAPRDVGLNDDTALAAAIVNDLPQWRPGADASAPTAPARPVTTLAQLVQHGFVTNVLNPKVALFFLALLPQFVANDSTRKGLALAILGLWFAVQGFVFLALFVWLAAQLRRWEPTPTRRRWLHLIAAFALLWVAARLLMTPSLAMAAPFIA